MDLNAAYRACAQLTRREARNFYVAFLALPQRQRLAVYALYAFCRNADDAVDAVDAADPCDPAGSHESLTGKSTEIGGSALPDGRTESIALDSRAAAVQPSGSARAAVGQTETRDSTYWRRVALDRLRNRLAAAAEGRPEDDPDLALADAISTYGVDPDDLGDVLTGMEMDLTLRRVATFEELRTYCYHAASAVGLATLPILNDGVPPTDAMREAAIDLGLGMQLVNILRDVAEDLDRDRIYLPQDEIGAFGATEEDLAAAAGGAAPSDALRAFLAFQADRAAETLAKGRRLVDLLPRRGGRCPALLAAVYGRILERIRAGGFEISRRASLPASEKLGLLLRSLAGRS